MIRTERYLLIASSFLTFLFIQKGYTQDNAINTGTMYISTGTIVSDEGSFTTSATGSSENNGDFYLKGDWINDGSYPTGTGKVTFWGTTAQNISGTTGTTFYNAEVDKASNGVTVNINTEVSNILTLTNGPVDLNSHTVTISNPATTGIGYTNGVLISEQVDNSSKVQWNIGSTTGAHVIPYAKADGTFIPLTLDLTAGTIGNLTTSTYPSAADNTPYPVTPNAVANMNGPSGSDNSANVVDRFWQLDKTGASGTLTVTFTYGDAEAPANGETGLVAQRYSSGWEAPVPFQSNNTALNTVTSPGITLFGPYTLSQSAFPLPVQLLSFEAHLVKQKHVNLKWKTASETNNNYFTVERSKDLNEIESIGIINGAVNSTSVNEYNMVDKNPYYGTSFYRIKQTDFDGSFSHSHWNTIYNNDSLFEINYVHFNSHSNEFKIVFTIPENGFVTLKLYSAIGAAVFSKVVAGKKGSNTFAFPVNHTITNGMYNLNAIYSNEIKSAKLISHY
ncbi:MAG: hypothetical protein ACHQNT_00505 [Bacteroidia bacterium]